MNQEERANKLVTLLQERTDIFEGLSQDMAKKAAAAEERAIVAETRVAELEERVKELEKSEEESYRLLIALGWASP